MSRKWRVAIFTGVAILILSSVAVIVAFSKPQKSKKLDLNQVYTYDKDVDKTIAPSYIKFIDNTHFVAILGLNNPKESFGDGEYYSYNYLEGTYERDKDEISLSGDFKQYVFKFPTIDAWNKKKYEKIGVLSKNEIQADQLASFQRGKIEKRNGVWQFQWRTKNNTEPVKYNYGWVKLKKSKKKIPDSIDDLLKEYKKISDEE
ncbi:hypothetical protein P7D85_20440 [Enterococcus hulanensis]|uniref:Uncharacterized protein n=1 Tax=Enterococcus hulanensis TaxID=2559929 RepID=A0ABU3F4S3_9ENTE|nr:MULTISPECIES: hypothetical protein [Enterococcus]MBX8938101.1 hypothetical protein [Enterococcus gilvus]MDT2602134.1 hypothetical protein [Enterococcus hulanensis]MDT2608429.1 hypothetical protein [Enterococcus hulanensis]MDT2615724.1 hypothetical protein [Enterococcus hulanensis]MDT2630206.1 hypothetical protein [Enterococcus hulanensis]